MSDLKTLEGRISSALDRIRVGMAAQHERAAALAPQADVAQTAAALQKQLDEERLANAQLEERVRSLKLKNDEAQTALETQTNVLKRQVVDLESGLQRLRTANADLREITASLRATAADGAASPELINKAAFAEIEALQAERAAEMTEIDALVSSLKPLIEEA